jgi:general secretion pathway protein N
MRFRLQTRPAVLFTAMFAAALLLLLPLRLVAGWAGLGEAGLSARAVHGSVWLGTMDEAAAGGVALGDLRARLSPLNLLLGRARVTVRSRGNGPAAEGAVTVSRHSNGVDDLTASLPTGAVFAPLPITQLDLSGASVRFDDGRCARAQGRVRAVVTGDVGGVDLGGSMAGEARCDAGALLIPLRAAAGGAAIELRLPGNGRFHADLIVPGGDAATVSRLQLAGFQAGPSGYMLSAEGRF